ncbi:RagB/SusD family nutrient uptake outer membrane protein [Pedobacter nototheniae]|uniref:RagB/SusD family nutrient uptake outer membrane protein n=1 Tax=Pedobacter nototheniae TaxID=2488994 RepID=UPI0029306DAC|nr:RagB/SusD family nutrient uptake outer membrane protein [Pedobacter nototheniae]
MKTLNMLTKSTSNPSKMDYSAIKRLSFIMPVVILLLLASCKKLINVEPQSNVTVGNYYRNFTEVNAALTGCYNGLQEPLSYEWMLTELRSDNVVQHAPTSASSINDDFNDLNLYTLSAQNPQIYNYYLSVYKNIRNINYVLRSLGVSYSNGQLVYGEATAKVTPAQKAQLVGQALFLRSYHYFNLVRLFGGMFVLTEPVIPSEAKQINRSSQADTYQLILADLLGAKSQLTRTAYGSIPAADLGRATAWAAEALLAKVYLTLGRKADALPILNDIITSSGYGLETTYARVFSINNEMNKEILFAVRYKSGLVGLGNPMANSFAPSGSGDAVVPGDGSWYNCPSQSDLVSAYKTPSASTMIDSRKAINIASYGSTSTPFYNNKFISAELYKNDAENDFPVLRYADILLMKAEATGFDGATGSSMAIVNQIRQRAGAGTYSTGTFNTGFYLYPASGTGAITDASSFQTAMLNERRLELAFENQRFFDLVRNGVLVATIKNHYVLDYALFYTKYKRGTADVLGANVTEQKALLPIPQREIDVNNEIIIPQNPGY